MRFPYCLSKVKASFLCIGEDPAVARAKYQYCDEPLASLLSNTVLHNNGVALSYLWVAMELNLNVLIMSNSLDTTRFTDSLSAFIPPYQTVIDTRKDHNVNNGRTNFARLLENGKGLFNGGTKTIMGMMPDRVIAGNSVSETKNLFRVSKYGISFIASVNADCNSVHTVKMLQSKPFNISNNDMCMLDIVVAMKDDNTISRITEYKWVERAELIIREDDIASKRYSNMLIFDHGAINPDICASKVAKVYSRSNVVAIKEISNELSARAKFLSSVDKYVHGFHKHDPILMYYDIK